MAAEDVHRVVKFLGQERWQRSPGDRRGLAARRHGRSIDHGRRWLAAMADAADRKASDPFGWLAPSDDRDLLLAVVPELVAVNRMYLEG